MGKKCGICSKNAEFCIKGTSDYYCKECAYEQFGDIAYLVKIEDDAKALKKIIEDTEEPQEGQEEQEEELDIAINKQ